MADETTTDPNQPGTVDDNGPSAHELAQQGKGFSPEQSRQMAEWAVEDGTLTREEADAMLQADGLDPLTTESGAEPGSVKAQIDEAFPPAEAQEFDLPPLVDDSTPYTKETRQFDELRRQWLVDARFPKGIGESVMKHAHDSMENYNTLDDDAKELQKRVELERTREHFGDDADEMLALAAQLVEEIDKAHPGLIGFLEATGAGNNRFVVAQFALQAKRLYDRQG